MPRKALRVPAYQLVDDYIAERSLEAGWSKGTAKVAGSFKSHIGRFSKDMTLAQLAGKGRGEFVNYLRYGACLEETTVKKYYKSLRSFLSWAEVRGYLGHETTLCRDPVFKTPARPVVFLSIDELVGLMNYELPPEGSAVSLTGIDGRPYLKTVRGRKRLSRARDLFCFSALTGLRYSDLAAVRSCDIRDGELSLVSKKTSRRIAVMLGSCAMGILEKYRGSRDGRPLPLMSNQRMNACLKEVCELFGLNQPVHLTGFKAGKRYDKTVPRHSLITSHCGRRTFICSMLSLGIAPQVIMKMTGHSNYSSMKPYIDTTEKDKSLAIEALELRLAGRGVGQNSEKVLF